MNYPTFAHFALSKAVFGNKIQPRAVALAEAVKKVDKYGSAVKKAYDHEKAHSEYEQAINQFLADVEITMTTIFLGNRPSKFSPGHNCDMYQITFSREGRMPLVINEFCQAVYYSYGGLLEPTAYSVLAGITKDAPESFEFFCADYGLNTDSIADKQTWEACLTEWDRVNRFFDEAELDFLRENAV
jgi:hypothetical protein